LKEEPGEEHLAFELNDDSSFDAHELDFIGWDSSKVGVYKNDFSANSSPSVPPDCILTDTLGNEIPVNISDSRYICKFMNNLFRS